ncbi:MAG: Uma2 family endonuclease [Cyanobacteria bacterium]|nr:Uma2 family endonuclease [Cyanobacteria bacterium CG_2015-16_32_12]NCO78015.1 Uma2 family endonuclease [Cyanobacteria bacterium CG_2015-22_32_23]NCQ03246.1 Uma2 family endonuclease [Cyanobacteria bacterium CG_2015-09_32_10]NCS85493.1 Uma2 family endonuclease [Cyanobacteria bacterium CG_2015-02_32_10]
MISTIEPKAEQKYYTVEEYLALEETAEEKHEYHNGEIITMTGGTTNHNTLALTIASFFFTQLSAEDYQVYINDVRLFIEQYNRYTYPDVMIVKGKPMYQGKGTTSVKNPLLIVEVLSKSTQHYDQTDKFDAYRSIPDLQEYIVIDQYQYYVKQFAKNQEGKWVLTDYIGKEAILKLEYLPLEVTLENLYQRVNFNVSE